MIRTTTEVGADGTTVVVKRGDGGADDDRLRREAHVLAAARHPGVVELVDPTPGFVEVRTRFAGPRTLATARLPAAEAVTVLAELARTMADLHARGLVHGDLTDDHVVLGTHGRPRLCGFGHAGPAGERRDGTVLRPSLDVGALAAMAGRLLDTDDGSDRPGHGARRRLDGLLGASSTSEGPRPSARRLADALAATAGRRASPRSRRVDGRASVDPLPAEVAAVHRPLPAPPRGARATGGAVAAAVAGLTAIVLGVGSLVGGGGTAADSSDPAPAATSTSTAPSPSTEPTATTADPEPIAADGLAAEPVEPARPGGLIAAGPGRFLVGAPDDLVLVADWGCRGRSEAVVVRPSGDVYRFEGWATRGHDLTGVAVGRVDSPGTAHVGTRDDGCPVLETTSPTGTTLLDPGAG